MTETDNSKPTDQKETDFMCTTCKSFFVNQSDVKNHVHTQYFCKYMCKLCSRQFNTKGGFVVHVLQHGLSAQNPQSRFQYKCERCSSSFDDCYQLKRHYAISHQTLVENPVKPAESVKPSGKKQDDKQEQEVVPIYDCEVCYDIFTSETSLNKHKQLHVEFESKKNTIVIDDDDVVLIQDDKSNDAESNSNVHYQKYVVTRPETTHPNLSGQKRPDTKQTMARLTPTTQPTLGSSNFSRTSSSFVGDGMKATRQIRILPKQPGTPSPLASKKRLVTRITQVKQPKKTLVQTKLRPGNFSNASSSLTSDKTKLTRQITDMLGGKKINNPNDPPALSALSQSHQSVLKPNCIPGKSLDGPPPLTKKPKYLHNPADIVNPGGNNVASGNVAEGQQQIMYVMDPQTNSLIATPCGVLPDGQNFVFLDPRTSMASSGGFILNSQEGTSTIVPGSPGQNQFIINQQINSGGVVINPQTGNLMSGGFVINQNMGSSPNMSLNLPGSNGIQPAMAAAQQTPDGQQLYYLVMPTTAGDGQQEQQKTDSLHEQPLKIKPRINKPLMMKPVQQQATKPVDTNDFLQDDSNFRLIKPLQESKHNETISLNSSCNSNNSDTFVMPLTSDFKSTESETSISGETDDALNSETAKDEEVVLPIITSIGTVAEDSTNTNEKISKDPTSKYESEFARFLQKNKGNTALLNRSKFGRVASIVRLQSESDDVLVIDENSSSDLEITEIVPAPAESTDGAQNAPRITVKKLSDLVETAKSTSKDSPTNCDTCKKALPNARAFQEHLSKKIYCPECPFMACSAYMYTSHMKVAHKFHECKTCNYRSTSTRELADHMSSSHYCQYCDTTYANINSHRCGNNPNRLYVQPATLPSGEGSSQVPQDIFAQTGTDFGLS